MNNHDNQGFSIIELMLVVLIMGILATIAYPNYLKYDKQTNRADVMSEMQQMAHRIEANKLIYKKYDNIPLADIAPSASINSGKFNYPFSGKALYEMSILDTSGSTPIAVNGNTLSTSDWQIQAKPLSSAKMEDDGNLTLDDKGEKCWKTSCGTSDEWKQE